MFEELILVCLFGGLVALDKTEAFQSMFSQPLLIGPLVGLLLHHFQLGLEIGILLQLAYLWLMPIGTATFPDPAVGAVVGSSGFIILKSYLPHNPNLILLLTLLFVIPFSLLTGWTLIKQRQLNFKLLQRADLYAEKGDIKKFGPLFFLGISGSFLRGFILTGFGLLNVFVLLIPLAKLLQGIPESYLQNLDLPIWGLGIGALIYLFGRRKNFLWCFGGACMGIIVILL